jgi:hypothetical protein
LHTRRLQLLQQSVAGRQHLGHVAIHIGLVGEGGEGGGDGEAVDVVGPGDPPDPFHQAGGADGEADAQPGDAGGLRQ